MSSNRFDFVIQEHNTIRDATKLLYVSSAKYNGDWHSNPHTHSCSELFYVIGGSGQFFIEGKTFPVNTNDLVIVNPNIEHTEVSLNSNPLEYIVLGVEGLELSVSDESDNDNRYCIVNFRSMRDNVLMCLQNILHEIEEKAPGYDTICQNLIEVLLIFLSRQTNFSTTMTPIRKTSSRLCATVRHYIDEHYKENVSLDTLAQLTHVSKYYMVHAFSKEYGISPINYMVYKRIEEAKHLLKNDDYTLALISRMLGFSSPSYFSQSFKKATGMTPNEYRKNPF